MAYTRNFLGLIVCSCVTYLLFLHLNECPLCVHAAELPADKLQRCSDGGLREQHAVDTNSGEESSTATGTPGSLTPISEAPQEVSGDAEAGEASAAQPPFATDTPTWCRGPVYTLQQLSQTTLSLPLPSLSELIQPQCADWLTVSDARGRHRVLQMAQHLSENAATVDTEFDSPSGLLGALIPAAEFFDLEMVDARDNQQWQHATFRRGHIVAYGGYGVITIVQLVRSSAATRATDPVRRPSSTEQAHGAVEPAPAGEPSVLGVASTDAKGTPTMGNAAHRVECGPAESVQGDATEGRKTQEGCQTSSTSDDAGLHSAAASTVPKTTQHAIEEAYSSARAPSTYGALRGSAGFDSGRASAFHLCRRLAYGKRPRSIFAAKVAYVNTDDVPESEVEREKLAEKEVKRRLDSFRRLWEQMPEGFTADDLYNLGFVVPLASARLSNKPNYLIGFPWTTSHILNHFQLLYAQVSDIFNSRLFDQSSILYMVKRIIQLSAHLQAAGLVHLDVKKENIGVSPTGDLTLLDFDHVLREGSEFLCRERPTPCLGAPENCAELPYFTSVVDDRKCVATTSLDRWNVGLLIYELVCYSMRYFRCYNPEDSYVRKVQCLASLQPPPPVEGEEDFSPTRAPVWWGNCRPSKQLKHIIYGFLDLDPEKRLDPLKVFVYSDLFRSSD